MIRSDSVGAASSTFESGRLGNSFLRVIFERRPCRNKAGDAATRVQLQIEQPLDGNSMRRNPVDGARACLFEDEFAQRCWRGEVAAGQPVVPPLTAAGISTRQRINVAENESAEKLNHERPKGVLAPRACQ